VITTSEFETIHRKSIDHSHIMTDSTEQQVIDLGDEQYAFDSLSD